MQMIWTFNFSSLMIGTVAHNYEKYQILIDRFCVVQLDRNALLV